MQIDKKIGRQFCPAKRDRLLPPIDGSIPLKRDCQSIILCAVILLLTVSCVFATTTATKEITCPLCGTKFDGYNILNTDSLGGMDSDFLSYSVDDLALNFKVNTCPYCLYSFTESRVLTPFQKESLNKIMKPLRAKYLDGFNTLTPWEKYEIAAVCEEALGDNPTGDLLNAVWCLRFYIVNEVVPEMKLASENLNAAITKKIISAKIIEMGLPKNECQIASSLIIWSDSLRDKENGAYAKDIKEQPDAYIRLLKWYHRLGYYNKQTALLSKLLAEAKDEHEQDISRLKGLFDLMLRYQQKLIEHLVKDIDSKKVTLDERCYLYYLIAEQNRRIGNNAQAKEWYAKALKLDMVGKEIACLAQYQIALLDEQAKLMALPDITGKRININELITQLKNPDMSAYAADNLIKAAKQGLINDDRILNNIGEGLKNEDKTIRRHTVNILGWTRRNDILKPLAKVMLEDRDPETRKAAAEALTRTADFSMAESFIKALLNNDAGVTEPAILGLERLTNQSYYSDETENKSEMKLVAYKWIAVWKTKKAYSQEQWILEGFQKEGTDLQNLSDQKNIPLLVSALQNRQWFIQYNANEYLKKITGVNFESKLTEPIQYLNWKNHSKEIEPIIAGWQDWLNKNTK